VCPKNPANFNVDNVRVAKLLGGGLHNSTVVRGLVLKSDAVGTIKQAEKAKVSFYCVEFFLFNWRVYYIIYLYFVESEILHNCLNLFIFPVLYAR